MEDSMDLRSALHAIRVMSLAGTALVALAVPIAFGQEGEESGVRSAELQENKSTPNFQIQTPNSAVLPAACPAILCPPSLWPPQVCQPCPCPCPTPYSAVPGAPG